MAILRGGPGCIGVGARKFLGVQRIFAQIFSKSCRETFADRFFGVTSEKWFSLVFLRMLGVMFVSERHLEEFANHIHLVKMI